MNKFKVINARVEQVGSVPFSYIIVAEVELQSEDGETIFFSNAEVEGMPSIYKTTTSKFEELKNPENEDVEKEEPDLIYTSGNYDELSNMQNSITPFDGIRYLIYITQASWDETKDFIEKTKGKYLSDVEIPQID